jgi:hypothetical protein
MPALNFKAQFADQVKNLEKRQTIRARGKRRPPRVGEPLMLYTGMRQVGCHKLLDAVCTSVEPISMSIRTRLVKMPRPLGVEPIWTFLDDDELEAFAIADGFASADAFFAWFAENHGDTFSGYVIKW